MTLAPGTRLGPYEILFPIGAGGMGEVFRARDPKLNRDVAIKVLPAALAEDRERVARFRREAQLLAALHHPNVASVFGLEEASGTVALVMELVEGEDLAQRLERGALPVDEAIAIAKQIAEGLEAAHEKGIVHRDLKPANVKLTREGVAKILDFGLAKALEGDDAATSGPALTQSPTMSRHMTEAGMLLGTAAYMSPEQARGKGADKRADIWAFGVVLHEMLTGQRLFAGETVSDTLAAVLRQEVDLALPAATPPHVRRLLARCLERDPRKRLRDIGEARVALDGAATEPLFAAPPEARAPRGALVTAGLGLLALGFLTAWALVRAKPAAPRAITRLSITLPPGQVLSGNGGPAITRDGRLIAYTARERDGSSHLYLRPLDRFETRTVPESDGAQQPFFSPDGTRVAFFARGYLMAASVAGGAPTSLAGVSAQPLGGTWGDDGTIVFARSLTSGLHRVSATVGAKTERLTEPDEKLKGYAHGRPQWLPGGRTLLFSLWGASNEESRGTVLLDLASKTWTRVRAGYWTSRWSTSGHLLVSGPRGVRAARFDPGHPQSVDPQVFVIEDVFSTIAWADSWFAVSDEGTLVYVPAEFLLGTPSWVDREGRVTPAVDKPLALTDPLLSPDGQRLAYQDKDDQLWTVDLHRGTRVRLTADAEGSANAYPVWTPDGKRVFYASNRSGDWEVYSAPAAGGPTTRVLTRKGNQFPQSFAPDGTLLFAERADGKQGSSDLLALAPDGTVTPVDVSQRISKVCGQISPDGRLMTYVSDESGRDEVYVRTYPGAAEQVPVSTEGGDSPRFTPDGREVVYRRGDVFFAAAVSEAKGALTAGDSRKLFEVKAAQGRSTLQPGYSIAPDGRFLVHLLDPKAIPTRIEVVLNWFDELNAKVPAR